MKIEDDLGATAAFDGLENYRAGSARPTRAAVFGKVDFMVYTAGVSGSFRQFTFAFGVNSRRGSIDNLVLKNLITGPVQTSLQIKTIGITYALNYKFGK